MFDKTKGIVFWAAVGLAAAGLTLGILWGILRGFATEVTNRTPSIPSSFSAPAPESEADDSLSFFIEGV